MPRKKTPPLTDPNSAVALADEPVMVKIVEMCAKEGVDPNDHLTEADVKKWMVMTHGEKNMITLIGQGYPIRNANTIIRAIELKMERNPQTARVTPSAGDGAALTITVKTVNPASLEEQPVQATVEAAPRPAPKIAFTSPEDEDDFDA